MLAFATQCLYTRIFVHIVRMMINFESPGNDEDRTMDGEDRQLCKNVCTIRRFISIIFSFI